MNTYDLVRYIDVTLNNFGWSDTIIFIDEAGQRLKDEKAVDFTNMYNIMKACETSYFIYMPETTLVKFYKEQYRTKVLEGRCYELV